MKRVVADTGPIFHLHQAGALHLLPLIGEISLTPTVLAEVQRHAPELFRAPLPAWARLVSLSSSATRRAAEWQQAGLLHSGEAEALALAFDTRPDWFITDDAAARLMAELLGLEAHGSLGIVLWAAGQRMIPKTEAETLLNGLEASSLWLSPAVKAQARAALNNIYSAD